MALVLTRRVNERIRIGDTITVEVVRVTGGQVRLSIEAPKDVLIARDEVWELVKQSKKPK
jgi:carbon storage regulator